MPAEPPRHEEEYDPVYLHARREAVLILAAWAAALVWTLSVYVLDGLSDPGDDPVVLWLGLPRWVLLGIALPWVVADVFAAWFCLVFMANDDLGQGTAATSAEGSPSPETGAATAERDVRSRAEGPNSARLAQGHQRRGGDTLPDVSGNQQTPPPTGEEEGHA